jgi:hypothetical protein
MADIPDFKEFLPKRSTRREVVLLEAIKYGALVRDQEEAELYREALVTMRDFKVYLHSLRGSVREAAYSAYWEAYCKSWEVLYA